MNQQEKKHMIKFAISWFLGCLIGAILISCNNKTQQPQEKKEDLLPLEIHVEVTYQDTNIDTIVKVYNEVGNDGPYGMRPRAYLDDNGCLKMGFEGLFFKSMSNVACDVRTFKPLYLITKQNDTIQ